MSDKSLAYMVTITSLEPIQGKDRIVLAGMSETEFKCIVQKDEFKIGDPAIYFEIGAILPIVKQFQFLEKRCYSKKYNGYVIKSMKMGEVYSDGLLVPMSSFPEFPSKTDFSNLMKLLCVRRKEDDIIDDTSKVKKTLWRKIEKWLWLYFKFKITRQGFLVMDFPEYCMKTDETQVQSLGYIFTELQDMMMYATKKCDGQSITFALHKGIFTISTRNRTVYKAKIKKACKEIQDKKIDKLRKISAQAYMAGKYNIPQVLSKLGNEIALQGELCGPGIQKNRLGLKDYEIFFFNLQNLENKKFFGWDYLKEICANNNLNTVPFIGFLPFNFKSVKETEKYTEQFTYDNGYPVEGVVFRAYTPGKTLITDPLHKMHGSLSFKCINPKFKMKTQDDE
jgi:hypothetical protein